MALQVTLGLQQDTNSPAPETPAFLSRSDLTNWVFVPILATTGGATVSPIALNPNNTVLPVLALQNNGTVAVSISVKLSNGGTAQTIPVAAGAITLLSQVDYATAATVTTASGTAACYCWLGMP